MVRILAALLLVMRVDFGVAVAAEDRLVEACEAVTNTTVAQMAKYGEVITRKGRDVTITMPGGSNMVCYFVSATAEVPQVWKITLSGYRQDENLVANSNLNIRTHFSRHK
jgi:hypothetical protein